MLCGFTSIDHCVRAVHVKCLFVFYLQSKSHGVRSAVQSYVTGVLQNPNFTAAFKVSNCFVRITVAAIMSEACARVSSMLSI